MYRKVEWAVPADPYILEEMSKYEGWQTPKNVEINTKFSRQWVSQRCPVYVEHGVAERYESELAYRITELGVQLVSGEVEYEEFNQGTADEQTSTALLKPDQ